MSRTIAHVSRQTTQIPRLANDALIRISEGLDCAMQRCPKVRHILGLYVGAGGNVLSLYCAERVVYSAHAIFLHRHVYKLALTHL